MWPYPKIVAHRGGGTLAPENTFAALRCALAYGFHAVEFDVMLSRDGVGVVLHDDVLGRTVAGAGSVADLGAAELAALDAGSWFSPLFADEKVPNFGLFVDYCKAQRIWMNIEIKPVPGFERETGRVVAGVTRACFGAEIAAGDPAQLPLLSSFSAEALAAAREAAPYLPRALLIDCLPHDWLARARALDVVAVHTNQRHLTAALARAVKDAGLGLFCYTVNEPGRARELLGWGVDGFCTDRIDLIGPDFA
ncbi:glycerophosphoryl diester phosphodiesterase [Janthinobacterium sp. CG_23.3]|uniref:glycerophosphodiester phosphodiesterase n=1 Tax=unclassified Janthinobacterium TaxID=2610881 RepID=UPI000349698B|nr:MULTISPECIES: glycerophosphodiester phosphodiesterase [unclassified Janthinobacterium]MEC5162933.1 glycerophosphoryl diester phosphodiesterase [Janthinobacterium sp. CG_S6]